jgi:hypothetical protein
MSEAFHMVNSASAVSGLAALDQLIDPFREHQAPSANIHHSQEHCDFSQTAKPAPTAASTIAKTSSGVATATAPNTPSGDPNMFFI